jgi:hypothetical protein
MVESYLRANKMFVDHSQVFVFHMLSRSRQFSICILFYLKFVLDVG